MGENQMKKLLLLLSLVAVTPILKGTGTEDFSFLATGKGLLTGLYIIGKGLVMNGICTTNTLTGIMVGHILRRTSMDTSGMSRPPFFRQLITKGPVAVKELVRNPSTTTKGFAVGVVVSGVFCAGDSVYSYFKKDKSDHV